MTCSWWLRCQTGSLGVPRSVLIRTVTTDLKPATNAPKDLGDRSRGRRGARLGVVICGQPDGIPAQRFRLHRGSRCPVRYAGSLLLFLELLLGNMPRLLLAQLQRALVGRPHRTRDRRAEAGFLEVIQRLCRGAARRGDLVAQ